MHVHRDVTERLYDGGVSTWSVARQRQYLPVAHLCLLKFNFVRPVISTVAYYTKFSRFSSENGSQQKADRICSMDRPQGHTGG